MKLTLTLNLDHDEDFKHDDGTLDHGQVAVSVWEVQDYISEGDTSGTITAFDGTVIGKWEIR